MKNMIRGTMVLLALVVLVLVILYFTNVISFGKKKSVQQNISRSVENKGENVVDAVGATNIQKCGKKYQVAEYGGKVHGINFSNKNISTCDRLGKEALGKCDNYYYAEWKTAKRGCNPKIETDACSNLKKNDCAQNIYYQSRSDGHGLKKYPCYWTDDPHAPAGEGKKKICSAKSLPCQCTSFEGDPDNQDCYYNGQEGGMQVKYKACKEYGLRGSYDPYCVSGSECSPPSDTPIIPEPN